MSIRKDPLEVLVVEKESDDFAELADKPMMGSAQAPMTAAGAVTARFHGFDLQDRPLVTGLPDVFDQIVVAQTTLQLLTEQIGSTVIVLFDHGDARRPIIVGVIQTARPKSSVTVSPDVVSGEADGEGFLVSAEPAAVDIAWADRDREAGAQNVRSSNDAAQPDVVTGVLIGFRDQGRTPLVIFPGQTGTAAVAARTTQDLHAAHIGRPVVLIFERADARLPIIVGSIKAADRPSLADHVGHAEVEADGERLIVSAKEQLVLQCGKASITLTKAGKVLIQGTYVSTRSSGEHRIKGGSVQIN